MSIIYKSQPGDTFEKISLVNYKTERYARRIQGANPDLFYPILPGSDVIIPDLPARVARANNAAIPANYPDEVALTIGGKRFRFFEQIKIEQSLDSYYTAQFSAVFNPNDKNHRELFRPFSFAPVVVSVGGKVAFAGTLVGVNPSIASDSAAVNLSCYSTPAVLDDCTASAASYPLEFNGLTLQEIAEDVAAPFGIAVVVIGDAGKPFERVACEPSKKLGEFLRGLAKQRGLFLTSNTQGDLVIIQPTVGKTVANLEQGKVPLLSVSAEFDAQKMHTHVTGIEPPSIGFDGAAHTQRMRHTGASLRPFTFALSDTDGAPIDAKQAVTAQGARMYASAVSYEITVATWRDARGELWSVGDRLTLIAPGAMIYKKSSFVIRSVSFERANNRHEARITLALPESMHAKIPESVPWD